MSTAKQTFQAMEAELVEVDVEGWRAIALRSTLEPMQQLEAADTMRLRRAAILRR